MNICWKKVRGQVAMLKEWDTLWEKLLLTVHPRVQKIQIQTYLLLMTEKTTLPVEAIRAVAILVAEKALAVVETLPVEKETLEAMVALLVAAMQAVVVPQEAVVALLVEGAQEEMVLSIILMSIKPSTI